MKYKDETPDNLGGLSDVLSAEVLKMINELLEQLQRAGHINNGSKIELVYVAPGAQHVETQVIASPCPETLPSPFPSKARLPVAFPCLAREKETGDVTPPPEVMIKAIEKTVSDGLWATSTCWSVVYVVYRILGYEGSISDFVRDVESWKFARPLKYKCNRDSVGKPLRDKRMSYNLNRWLSNGVQKPFYLLAVALVDEVRKTFPSFPSDIPHLP